MILIINITYKYISENKEIFQFLLLSSIKDFLSQTTQIEIIVMKQNKIKPQTKVLY